MNLPIVVTMGDPSGVGPEILVKAYAGGELKYPFFAVGDGAALRLVQKTTGICAPVHIMADECDISDEKLSLYDQKLLSDNKIAIGQVSRDSGAAARSYIETATRLTLEGRASAIVTLPVNKEAVQLSCAGFTGHTEMIAEMCGQSRYTMMLASDKLTVTHVSTHVSMSEAVASVTRARVLDTICLTYDVMRARSVSPKIAVAGLNAHAGENGLFGREEIEYITPAIQDARIQGIDASGPYPPDTVFLRASKGEFDAVVCMYHDQGHIPLKLLDFSGGVNVTLGLDVVRTSVDHGTAFDIAYTGGADIRSFVRAFNLAARIAGMSLTERHVQHHHDSEAE